MGRVTAAVISSGCVILLLAMLAFAASPEAHELLHEESHDGQHECAITFFASGLAELPACQIQLPEPITASDLGTPEATPAYVVSLFIFLPPECGPPSVLHS